MSFLSRLFGREERASIESPSVPISSSNVIAFLGLDSDAATGEPVTIDSALGVPAIWGATEFLSGTLADLPLHLYERTNDGRRRSDAPLATVLHDAVNDTTSSFDWRKYKFDQVFTHGRGVSFIERNAAGRPINFWPLDPAGLTIRRREGRKLYDYSEGDSRRARVTYEASEVIDIPFKLKSDMLTHRSPIMTNRDIVAQAIAMTRYASKFFANGGVPPFAITGPFQSPGGMQRAAEDLSLAVQKAAKEKRLALSLPAGHEIKSIGVDPEKSQMTDAQKNLIVQIARIYSLPPVFLQDLTHGTFSNTEQQDLHLVKHTLRRWVTQFEEEVNLKLFGRHNRRFYVEMNIDGLLRGDFKTRMDGYAQGVQNGILKPNEIRRRENLPDDPEGDRLFIQGATVPLGQSGQQDEPPTGDDDGT